MGWLGRSDVHFDLDGTEPGRTDVTMTEAPARGLIRSVARVTGSVVERSLEKRNRESLERLRTLLG
jgi:hypothetical protein